MDEQTDNNVFEGFDPPLENWSKLPHAFIEALHMATSLAELKVILYTLRHTWGYHEEWKRITIDEFCEGRKKKDGKRIDGGTGMSRNAVKDGIQRAIDHGFMRVETDASDAARIKKTYSLNIRGSEVDPPEGQKLTPGVPEVDPRTEKDTIERKPRNKAVSDFDTFKEEVERIFNVHGKRASLIAFMLLGRSFDVAYAKYDIDPPLTLEELRRFEAVYKQDHGGNGKAPVFPLDPIKIEDKIMGFRANGGKQTTTTYAPITIEDDGEVATAEQRAAIREAMEAE